jgi:hypothetical protein
VDENSFLAFGLRRISFAMGLSAFKAKKYELYIELNLSETDLLLQLDISHGLADIDIIHRS